MHNRTCMKRFLKGPTKCGQLWSLNMGGLLTQVVFKRRRSFGPVQLHIHFVESVFNYVYIKTNKNY